MPGTTSVSAKQIDRYVDTTYALIITDSLMTEKYVTSILREIINLGNACVVHNCEAAIKHIREHSTEHCSFIFYEHSDASKTYGSIIEALRQDTETANSPIVILAEQMPDASETETASLQLTSFLQRPFIPSALISLLFELFQEKDRRLAKRINVDKVPCLVDMGYYATKPYDGQLLNISYTGCLLQTTHDFDDCGNIDDIGSVSFRVSDGSTIKLSGKIVRAMEGEPHQIGFQFQNNEEEDLVRLGRLISALSKKTAATS